MAKRWWLLPLVGLALAGCSSGAATSAPTPGTATPDPLAGVASTTSDLAPTTTVPAPTTTAEAAPPVVEFVTPSGRLQLKVTFDVESPDDRPLLDAYIQFWHLTDVAADTNNAADPGI